MQKAAIFLAFAAVSACTFDIGGIPVDDGGLKDAGNPKRDAGSPMLHADCHTPLRSDDAEPRGVGIDLDGRPLFDLYRDVGCPDAASIPRCYAGDLTVCKPSIDANCLSIPPNRGVCDATSTDKKVFVSFDRGRCVAVLSFATQAAACCHSDEFIGFDCRDAWPYPHDGKPGQICARHADCERGLACRRATKGDFGVCSCPEQAGEIEVTSCL